MPAVIISLGSFSCRRGHVCWSLTSSSRWIRSCISSTYPEWSPPQLASYLTPFYSLHGLQRKLNNPFSISTSTSNSFTCSSRFRTSLFFAYKSSLVLFDQQKENSVSPSETSSSNDAIDSEDEFARMLANMKREARMKAEEEKKSLKERTPLIFCEPGREHTVLVDGSLFVRRSYWIYKHLLNGTLYGFTKDLMKMMEEVKPYSYLGVCFDPPSRKCFRNELFPEYKQNHPELNPELEHQLTNIPEATKALNVASIQIHGFEADDIIATYSRLAASKGHKAFPIDFTIIIAFVDLSTYLRRKLTSQYPLDFLLFLLGYIRHI